MKTDSETIQASPYREHDKVFFHLNALSDITRELDSLGEIKEIAETVLLTVMGVYGISQGFVLLIDSAASESQILSRGLEDHDVKMLRENMPQIVGTYFHRTIGTSSESNPPALITKQSPAAYRFCPAQTEILIQWAADQNLSGLGKKITLESYSQTDIQFLLCFTNHLIIHIRKANAVSMVRKLNSALGDKNLELERSLSRAEHTQKQLDRRVYHLTTLYDTMVELSGLTDTEQITETFLLLMMGTFSVILGYNLLLDKKENALRVTCRGIEKEKLRQISADRIEEIISRFLDTGKHDQPADVQIVSDSKLLGDAAAFDDTEIALVFAIDKTTLGFIGLGKKITDEDFSDEERELLLTLTNNFILFFENAIGFETIQKLNTDLERRNLELEKTVAELSASRHKIELLEKAKASIKSLIQKETERAGRVSIKDFVLILGIGLVLGLIFNFANPAGVDIIPQLWFHDSPPLISIDNAKQKYDAETAIFVDARPANFFDQRHISGAVNVPLALFDFVYMMKFSNLESDKEIIIYGRNISRHYDEEVAFKFALRSHTNLKLLSGGLSAWEKRGYPAE
jgi:rhodanese-related sulfurtransferase